MLMYDFAQFSKFVRGAWRDFVAVAKHTTDDRAAKDKFKKAIDTAWARAESQFALNASEQHRADAFYQVVNEMWERAAAEEQ